MNHVASEWLRPAHGGERRSRGLEHCTEEFLAFDPVAEQKQVTDASGFVLASAAVRRNSQGLSKHDGFRLMATPLLKILCGNFLHE